MEAAPPQPPDPAVLIDEIVEEFLLRLSPEDPAFLARVALVSRQWHRVVTGPSFRRRFRKLYRSAPPLLGYILSFPDSIRFVPLSSFRPPRTHRDGVRAVSSSHGRVLLHRLSEEDLIAARRGPFDHVPMKDVDVHLSMWHPITDEQQDLPVVPVPTTRYSIYANWDAAVVCAVGDGCDHRHCHFNVVFVGRRKDRDFSCFYSSEAGSWSDPVFSSSSEEVYNYFLQGNFVLIGTALYNTCGATDGIFKYDLCTHQMCNISITPGPGVPTDIIRRSTLTVAEDGRLGFAKVVDSTLRLWLRENGRLEESRAIDLRTLRPADALPDPVLEPCEAIIANPTVDAFAATGAGVFFLWTRVGCFTINLKSESCKKMGENFSSRIVPYVSFCTPAPGAGVAISSDEVALAGIAVSTNEGPGVRVAVSANEGPGAAGMCQVPKKLKLQVQGPLNQEGNE